MNHGVIDEGLYFIFETCSNLGIQMKLITLNIYRIDFLISKYDVIPSVVDTIF